MQQVPNVEISDVAMRHGQVTITLRNLSCRFSYPMAPAGLYQPHDVSGLVLELHRYVGSPESSIFRFATDYDKEVPVQTGQQLVYRPWWLPQAMDAAMDQAASWASRPYPNDHEHCLFSWEKIHSGERAWFNDKYGWVTNDSYKNFIEGDLYGSRRSSGQ